MGEQREGYGESGSNSVLPATGPPRPDPHRVLVAAGTWLAASRRGTQRLPGLRGRAAAAGRMAPVALPPGWMCYSDPHRPGHADPRSCQILPAGFAVAARRPPGRAEISWIA